jgi:hypothetical protein
MTQEQRSILDKIAPDEDTAWGVGQVEDTFRKKKVSECLVTSYRIIVADHEPSE